MERTLQENVKIKILKNVSYYKTFVPLTSLLLPFKALQFPSLLLPFKALQFLNERLKN